MSSDSENNFSPSPKKTANRSNRDREPVSITYIIFDQF